MGAPMPKSEVVYVYRGQVERGSRYAWREGYSETTADGGILYPWMTYRECQADAKRRGARARFKR